MDKHIYVSITPSTVVKVLLVCAAAWALWTLRDLALLVLTAVVIASAIEPGVEFFVKRRIPRAVSVTLMYLGVLGGLFALLYFFLPPILNDAQNFLSSAPQYLETLNVPGQLNALGTQAAGVSQTQSLFDTIFAYRSAFADTSGGVVQIASSVFGGIFSLILVIVLSFYFALQATGIDDFLRLVTPKRHEEYVVGLWLRAKRKIGQWMQGEVAERPEGPGGGGETRVVLRFPPKVAPVKAMVSPLLKNKPELVAKAREVRAALQKVHPAIAWDDNGNIGKRYRRQDEIGTPFCITVDFDTLGETPELLDTVTLRHRDTGEQERLTVAEAAERIRVAIS